MRPLTCLKLASFFLFIVSLLPSQSWASNPECGTGYDSSNSLVYRGKPVENDAMWNWFKESPGYIAIRTQLGEFKLRKLG